MICFEEVLIRKPKHVGFGWRVEARHTDDGKSGSFAPGLLCFEAPKVLGTLCKYIAGITVNDINPAFPIIRNFHNSHSLGSSRICRIYMVNSIFCGFW